MDAKTFLKTWGRQEAERVAEAAGTNYAYFYQIALGHRRPSVKLAERLERASDGRLGFAELLRPQQTAA
jgi:hypothetical protein